MVSPVRVAQSVICLATDTCLTACPGNVSSILVRSHTFIEIDHEIISTAILLLSADSRGFVVSYNKKVCAWSTGKPLNQACLGKKWLGELTGPRHDHSCLLGCFASKPNQTRNGIRLEHGMEWNREGNGMEQFFEYGTEYCTLLCHFLCIFTYL